MRRSRRSFPTSRQHPRTVRYAMIRLLVLFGVMLGYSLISPHSPPPPPLASEKTTSPGVEIVDRPACPPDSNRLDIDPSNDELICLPRQVHTNR